MKKTYQTPVIDIEKFDVIDVITESAAPGVVTGTKAAAATDGEYTVAAAIEW